MSKRKLAIAIIVLTLILDQGLKIWVKTSFHLGEEMELFGSSRMLLHFIENKGMAFGITLGGDYGKLILTVFRMLAILLLGIYLKELIKESKTKTIYIVGFALVLAGAIGNTIDSAFYGVLFSASNYGGGVAEWLPAGGGYAPLLYGKVVDMFFFPLLYGKYPQWIPWLGGEQYLFFKPVFNLADVAICVGVATLIIVQLREFSHPAGHHAKSDEINKPKLEEE